MDESAQGSAGTREGRIARSWRLSGLTWRLVRTDPAMLTLAVVAMIATFATLAVVYDLTGVFAAHRHADRARMALATLILAYPLTFISVFFNTAIAAAASAALDGRRMSLRQALAVPLGRLGQVALWSLLSSVVGVLIEQIASRLPLIGSIAVRLFGIGWSLASMFVVPILATEGCSAPACLSRSAGLFKKRWGEGIAGNVIILAWTVVAFAGLFLALVVGFVAARGSTGAELGVAGVLVIAFVMLLAASSVIRQAFAVVLYRYAAAGSAPGPFTDADLRAPFSRGVTGRRSAATAPGGALPGARSLRLWALAAIAGAALTLARELTKHHWAAHLGGRIAGAVLLFVLATAVVRLALELGARALRRGRR